MGSRRALILDAVVVPLAVVASGMTLLELAPVSLPVCGFGLAHLVHARGVAVAALAAVAATALAAAFAWPTALMTAPVTAALISAVLLKGRVGAWAVTTALTAAAFGGLLLGSVASAASEGVSLGTYVRAESSAAAETWWERIEATGPSGAERRAWREAVDTAEEWNVRLWPGTSLVFVGLGAVLAMRALSWVSERAGAGRAGLPPVDEWDVGWVPVALPAAAFATLAASRVSGGVEPWVSTVGGNLLVVSAAVFSLQGLGVTEAFMRRWRIGVVFRLLLYGSLVLLGPGTMLALPAIGVTDVWLDFRGRMKADRGSLERRHDRD